MTSKEALEELYKLTCIDNRNNVWTSCELCAVILQDLERLEKINEVWHKNEVMESVDINGNHLQEVYDFLRKTIKDLEKYKKAIKILKKYGDINIFVNQLTNKLMLEFDDAISIVLEPREYELLKEVIGNDK